MSELTVYALLAEADVAEVEGRWASVTRAQVEPVLDLLLWAWGEPDNDDLGRILRHLAKGRE